MHPVILTVIIVLSSVCFLFLAAGLAGYLYSCAGRDKKRDYSQMDDEKPEKKYAAMNDKGYEHVLSLGDEIVEIESYDGKKLKAHLIENGQKKRFIICMHGFRSAQHIDFGSIANYWAELGYGLLLPSQRSHGLSEGNLICYGGKERYDLKDWCEFLSYRYEGCEILLHGISMGGATVMMASSLELPPNVKGVIDDCGFTTPFDIIAYVSKTFMKIPRCITYSANIWSILIGHMSLKKPSSVKAAALSKLPKLIIHGEKDDFVPYYMSEEIYAAATGDKQFVSFPEATHAMSFYYDPELYKEKMREFSSKCFSEES